MNFTQSLAIIATSLGLTAFLTPHVQAATLVLYDQNFENPSGFVNDGGDVNIHRSVDQSILFMETNRLDSLFPRLTPLKRC